MILRFETIMQNSQSIELDYLCCVTGVRFVSVWMFGHRSYVPLLCLSAPLNCCAFPDY